MSATVGLAPRGREGTFDVEGRHNVVWKWKVNTGDRTKDEAHVVYTIMPTISVTLGMAHPSLTGHYLKTMAARQSSDDGEQWEVTGTFSQYDPTLTGGANPLDAAPKWVMRSNTRQIPLDVDATGAAIRNSAGQRFTQPVTRDFNEPLVVVTRNEVMPDVEAIGALDQTINSGVFLGVFPAKTCRFVGWEIAAVNTHPAVGTYRTVQYTFAVKYDTWQVRILDQGTARLVGGKRRPIYADESTKATIKSDPTMLDGSGGVLGDSADPVYLPFDVYEEADFDLFGFGPEPEPEPEP